ncbi:MAG: hypothetical protein KatS3mg129_1349 [Leptospiraceae bacterium]|nr:MAG: hypothetical protein KatS3mg129_1349 [Leptospiraceae bacterium]
MLMYILKFILTLICLNILLTCKTSQPYWAKQNQHIYSLSSNSIQMIFFIEPESNFLRVKYIIFSIFSYIDILKTYPYLSISNQTYKFIFYKNYDSYKTYRPFKIDSLAHFDRNSKIIHVPLTIHQNLINQSTPTFVIYHELIHAILEECCSHYPIWLNEGLALLLQNINKPFQCQNNRIYFPKKLLQNKYQFILKQIHLPYYPEFDKIYSIYEQNMISGLFIYYLYNTNQLMNYIQIINQNYKKDLFMILTKGNLKIYNKHKKDFYHWLLQIKGNRFLNGC